MPAIVAFGVLIWDMKSFCREQGAWSFPSLWITSPPDYNPVRLSSPLFYSQKEGEALRLRVKCCRNILKSMSIEQYIDSSWALSTPPSHHLKGVKILAQWYTNSRLQRFQVPLQKYLQKLNRRLARDQMPVFIVVKAVYPCSTFLVYSSVQYFQIHDYLYSCDPHNSLQHVYREKYGLGWKIAPFIGHDKWFCTNCTMKWSLHGKREEMLTQAAKVENIFKQ